MNIEKVLESARKEEAERIINIVVKLSNRIETENETVFDEWRAFKQFRNALMDLIKTL